MANIDVIHHGWAFPSRDKQQHHVQRRHSHQKQHAGPPEQLGTEQC